MITLFKKIGKKFYCLFRIYFYWTVVIKQWFSSSFLKYFFFPFKGFEPNKGCLYTEMNSKNRKDYVSDYFRWVTCYKINNPYKYYFMDKLNFYFFVSSFTKKACPVYGYYDMRGGFTEISTHIGKKLIYKPNKGTKGAGIFVSQTFEKNGFSQKLKDYIVCPYLVQDNYASRIFPDSLNTIRLFTGMLDGEPICVSAVHRFGRKGVKGVDNFSKGGISAKINIETGIMEKACYFTGKEKVVVTNHPDTNSPIVGVKVEGWEEMKKEMMELQRKLSFTPYLAWDIALLDGDYRIIEANHVSDVDLYQCHGPLMDNETNRRFFSQFK